MNQIQIDFSSQARDKGMKKALDHADRVHDGWSEKAYEFARNYVLNGKFPNGITAEKIRIDSIGKLPQAPKGQAWGIILVRLAKEGYLLHGGWTRAESEQSNRRPVTLWIKR